MCGAPLGAQVRKRTSGTLYVSYVCNPRLGRVCVGIVGHFLERHVIEALFTVFADPTTRELFAGADPSLLAAVTTGLDAVESDLRHLAGRWGQGEIDRVEWEAAREGFAARAQALRDRLGILSLPALDPCDVVERWEEMGWLGAEPSSRPFSSGSKCTRPPSGATTRTG